MSLKMCRRIRAISGCSMKLLPGDFGRFDAEAVRAALRPTDSHFPQSSLIVIENTHNRGGGICWSIEAIAEIRKVADEHGLRMHLDGARIFHAEVESETPAVDLAAPFESVSVCFSKGLGAPVGSVLVGSRELIKQGLRERKMLGGGMRQVGILAAAGIYALENHDERLADDH